jgi:anti-sigma B factor antagonist
MRFERITQDDLTILMIHGELDELTAPELRSTIDAIVDSRCKQVIVDLSGVDLIDSSGVAVLVSLFKRSRAHGGRMEVVGVRDQPLAVFKLLRMDRVFVRATPVRASVLS